MHYKGRPEPVLLICLRILNTRIVLTDDDRKYYLNQEKGYEGEVQFDFLTEKLQSNCYILNDLLLKVNNTDFQIDSAIIFQDTLCTFEVKNYEGDYLYGSDKFQIISGKEIKNPHDQLKRSTSLLRQLLQEHGFHLNVEAFVVFINPEFTLYQAPVDLPFIYPTQLKRLMKKLDMKPSRLNNAHKKLADKLVSLHLIDSPYTKLPPYEYKQLKKGITCKGCHSFLVTVQERKIVCVDCGFVEVVESAVMRSVGEIKILFPEMKITTNVVHEWCSVIESKKRISRILRSNLEPRGACKGTFFE